MSFRYIPETRPHYGCETGGCHQNATWRVEPPVGSTYSSDRSDCSQRWLCNECYGKACYEVAVRTVSLVVESE